MEDGLKTQRGLEKEDSSHKSDHKFTFVEQQPNENNEGSPIKKLKEVINQHNQRSQVSESKVKRDTNKTEKESANMIPESPMKITFTYKEMPQLMTPQ